ncbi:sulfatase-like hydrolase/transferase [Aequorivita capsosiphonis]|uniref:sulfatase-like hydrolase/transferase n=1 Tax=Aequorivita capsosiphonis TaxID=487317 RepID=UPI00047B7BD0|nr:sulfatase-like hydrolase/transferase [Aequorivita capsosiphonis]
MSHFFKKYFQESSNPLLTGLICGFYPLVFYFSNNFSAINSWEHLGFFLLFFIGIPLVVFTLASLCFKYSEILSKYKPHILFVLIIMTVATLMSQAMYLTIKKKLLLGLLIISVLAAWKLHAHFKKLLVIILLMSILPTLDCIVKIIEHEQKMEWAQLPDAIENVKFKETPNIYLIQPDGYVGKDMMESDLYHFNNPFYDWLEKNNFKVYENFRSNYPASLTSNSSMFAMKQHRFGKVLFPSIDMPNARDIIAGDNAAIQILRNNGYKNFFIVQDEYFQQNRPKSTYDYYNLNLDEIPYFSNDNNVKKVVFDDLKAAMDTSKISGPRFYFVEKLLPHHIHFSASKEEERDTYIEKIKEVNTWLETTVNYISEKDPDAIVIILADHGGWVGLGSYGEMFSTKDPNQIHSIYSTLAAIKWNGHLKEGMDDNLKSNVNVFRILFSILSENPEYLKYLEEDSSYNLKNGTFYKSVRPVIDDSGKVILN